MVAQLPEVAIHNIEGRTVLLGRERLFVLLESRPSRQQCFGYVVFLGAHGVYGLAGSRRRGIGRLHKILHTLVARVTDARNYHPLILKIRP